MFGTDYGLEISRHTSGTVGTFGSRLLAADANSSARTRVCRLHPMQNSGARATEYSGEREAFIVVHGSKNPPSLPGLVFWPLMRIPVRELVCVCVCRLHPMQNSGARATN